MDPYATHLPVLRAIGRTFHVASAVEFGAGKHSTPLFFDRSAFPDLERLVSVETSGDWAAQAFVKDKRLSVLQSSSEKHAFSLLSGEKFDLAFVDGPHEERVQSAIAAGQIARMVVLHDVEDYPAALDGFRYHYIPPGFKPQTAILTNDEEVFSKAAQMSFPDRAEVSVPEPSERDHIFVAVPCMDWLSYGLVQILIDFTVSNFMPESRFKFTVQFTNGVTPVDQARNDLVRMFLKTTATRLLFIDSDVLPPGNVAQLLWHKEDIVAGLVPVSQHGRTKFNIYRVDEGKHVHATIHPSGLYSCDAAGTGLMLIQRRVFESLEGPWFQTLRHPEGRTILGEDLRFCDRAREAGFSIAADHEVRAGHVHEQNMLDSIDRPSGPVTPSGASEGREADVKEAMNHG